MPIEFLISGGLVSFGGVGGKSQCCFSDRRAKICKIANRQSLAFSECGQPSQAMLHMHILETGKYGCRKVRVYATECGEQLGRDPSENGSSKSLVLKSFSREGTLWDSSLLVALTLWDTPVLCTPPLPLS